jgi:hypothetical protein
MGIANTLGQVTYNYSCLNIRHKQQKCCQPPAHNQSGETAIALLFFMLAIQILQDCLYGDLSNILAITSSFNQIGWEHHSNQVYYAE